MIKTKNNFVIEEEVYPSNEKIFGGNEVAYEAKCFDGFAILTKCAYEDEKYPETLYMVYPKRNMVLNDEEFAYNVLDYRGLFDIDIQDVRYGDIMIYCGEVCKDVPSVYSDIIKRENIVSKVNDLIVKNGSVQYKIEQAAWNGYEWNEENGSFTNDGVVRFENTCMQALETYDEIDVEVLEACFENII